MDPEPKILDPMVLDPLDYRPSGSFKKLLINDPPNLAPDSFL